MTPTAPTTQSPARPPLPHADVDRLADEIAELSSHLDAATHHLLSLIRRFDEGAGWATHGALSCAHWLGWRIGLDLGAARERVRVARALVALPQIDDALRRGAVSYAKVRALTRVATAVNEATLLEMARHATASQLERICRSYRRVRASDAAERPECPADEELRRFVRTTDTDDGMVRIEARLRPDEAALVVQALDLARRLAWRSPSSADGRDGEKRGDSDVRRSPGGGVATASDGARDLPAETPRRHTALTRADALVAIAEGFLSSVARGATPTPLGAGAAPVELVVHVDAAALRAEAADSDEHDPTQHHTTLADGTALSAATEQRLACDAAVVTVAHDARGKVTHTSRRTRRISSTLRRALSSRDGGCRFPGCTNVLTDAHHVVPWIDGGATTLSNLLLLCRRHHRLVHEQGYRIETAADGEPRFFRRDGAPVPLADERRASYELMRDGATELRDAHAERGLVIDATTAFPRWDGAPVDYALAVDALLADARRA